MSRHVAFLASVALVALGATVASAATIQVSTTITVSGNTFDGGNNTYVSNGLGDGSQAEGQSPIFRCENGGTIQNLIIGAPGADGIHYYNGCTVRNVRWTDVGEDASTVKGAGNVTIDGGWARNAEDKVMQINAASTYRISNFTADDFSTFVRQNGGTGFCVTLHATNIVLTNGNQGFNTDSTCTVFNHCNVSMPSDWDAAQRFKCSGSACSSSQARQSCSSTPTPTPRPATPTPRAATPTPTPGGGGGSLTAPSNCTATGGSRQITVSWSDNSSNETGFQVERSTGGSFSLKATVGAGVTSWTQTGLSSGNTYSYRVRAINGSGNSGYSNTATATVQ